ncbi:MAG: hypothetical protein ACRD6R_05955, partial [Candidatus Polarisedimenticolia bacterium]
MWPTARLCTKENLDHVAGHGGRFVTILPRTRQEDSSCRDQIRTGSPAVRWRKIHSIPSARRSGDAPDVYSSTDAGPQLTADGYRLIWIRSSQNAAIDSRSRQDRIRKTEVDLKELAAKVGRRKLRKRQAVEARVRTILAAHQVTGFLTVDVGVATEISHRYVRAGRPRRGDPVRAVRTKLLRLHCARNQTAIGSEARTDGVVPLVTNIKAASRRAVLAIDTYQPYIEKRFSLTKSEYGVAPIFLKKPRRVVALLHLYFVAIMLSALLERQVRSAMRRRAIEKIPILPEGRPTSTPTTPRILENFDDASWHEYLETHRAVRFPVELKSTAALLLDLA